MPKKPELDTSNTSLTSVEESDPFQRLLHALKNSPRSTKQPQIEEMSEDKRLSGSRPKVELMAEEAVIGTTVPVQVVAAEKEVKAALPRAFTGHQKDAKKFLREKLFFLSYMTDGPGEFWKNDKTDLLLTFDPEAEKVSWIDFMKDFKTSFKPLDTALDVTLLAQQRQLQLL
uniref:Retrotransposon gag domain-containing protein n=1 Tax=Moniliophthora roreri TaxID=221103 RepID=A0A0W0G5G8_MONRR